MTSRRAAGRVVRERGAAMVEVALVVPLLLALVIGAAEVGLRVQTSQNVVNGSRAAARVVSSAGDSRLADYDVLSTLSAALSDVAVADVERIIVFKPESDGSVPAGCDSASVTNKCNSYTGTDLSLFPTAFTGTTACDPSSPDKAWCPIDRETDLATGTDWIGVRVDVRHTSIAPFLDDRIMSDTTIMRIEPRLDP